MGLFYHEESPNSSFKRCKFLTHSLKEVFSPCRTCGRQISLRKLDEESLENEDDIEDEQEVVISEIIIRAMEAKAKRKNSFQMDSFGWLLSPTKGGLFMIQKPNQTDENSKHNHEETEDFYSISSSFTHYSSAAMIEQYLSVKTNFSNISEFEHYNELPGKKFVEDFWWGVDDKDLERRLVLREVCQCEGWPFGLCRKALLLPPLPKSPSESWLWLKKYSYNTINLSDK